MYRSLTFEPLISPALWITLTILAVVLWCWYGWKPVGGLSRRRWYLIMGLSASGTVGVLIVLLNPTWLELIPPPAGKPLLTILVDESESMKTLDVGEQQPRYQIAVNDAIKLEDELQSRFEIRIRKFSDRSSPTSEEELAASIAEGESTDLASAISESFAEDRPQGQAIVLLSDGIHNGSGGIDSLQHHVRVAQAMSVPIYPHTIGSDATALNDLEVSLGRTQELSYVGQQLPLTISLNQSGSVSDRANVVLLKEGEEVDSAEVKLTTNGLATVQFDLECDEAGVFRYEIRAESFPGEAVSENNVAPMILRVIEQPIRVMLLEGKPYWDAKFLIRTLASDPSLELDAYVRLAENRFLKREIRLEASDSSEPVDADAGVTRSEESQVIDDPQAILENSDLLSNYQVVVLGRDAEVFLTEGLLERIRQWVSRDGGSLICYRGSPVARVDQELGRLMPVKWSPTRESRFRVQMTDRGESLKWLAASEDIGGDYLGNLPSLATQSHPDRLKPLAVVLARAEKDLESPPVVTYQSYGVGRVVVIEGAGMWRWAFLAPQFQQHEHVYQTLWQSLLRWLVSSLGLTPGQDLALRTDRIRYQPGDAVSAMLLMREELGEKTIPQVRLTKDDGTELQTITPVPVGDEPGVYQVPFGTLPEGSYRAAVIGPNSQLDSASTSIAIDVRKNYRERIETSARPDLMQYVAQESGGLVLETADSNTIISHFTEHTQKSRPQRVRRSSAWDRWWVLLGVIALWATAWTLRRSSGLI